MFVKANPRWKVGTVDSNLWDIYRTFDVQTSDWYNFLIKDVEEKYMCIFSFDTVNRLINCHTPENATTPTSVFASFNNLIDNIEIEEKFSEVFTALNCTGANYLDIRGVNPTGGNLIYNFKWYKNKDWISEALITKITLWEEKIALNQVQYREILTAMREIQVKLTTATTELTELEGQLKADEQALAMLITTSNYDKSRYDLLVNKKNETSSKIASKKTEITNITAQLDGVKTQASVITDSLSFENNFTKDEISELHEITIVDNYQNNAFAKTDIMTQYEIQDLSQGLYDTAVKILDRICEPRYYFNASLVNFIFLKEYEKFAKQADVGSVITVEIKKGWRSKVVLLSIELDFDNPTDFNMEFSNRYRLDNGAFEFSDLFVDNSRGSTSYDWDKMIIGNPVKSGTIHEVNDFMNKGFDAANNSLKTAQGINMIFDGSGLHGRRIIDGILDPCEMWMTDNMFCMSDDNFNTPPKVALGRFKLPNSETYGYGINAQFLAGNLIVGKQFVMESENGSFKFDDSGAKLYNAIFEVINKSNIKRVIIDPNNGFKMQGRANPNNKWEDKIYLDNEGNANFIGQIKADSGLIGGLRIGEDGIFNDNNGDYWKTDGTGKFGLLTYTLNSATFKGAVYAKFIKAGKEDGWIDNGKIEDNSISGKKLEVSYRNGITNSIAQISMRADKNEASITQQASYIEGNKKSIASVTAIADKNKSSITQQAKQITGITNSIAQISMRADKNEASITQQASYIESNKKSIASITITANKNASDIKLKADTIYVEGKLKVLGDLDAKKATIAQLDATKAAIAQLDAKKATITDLRSLSANIDMVYTKKAVIGELNTTIANIKNLYATTASVGTMIANKFKSNVSFAGALNCVSMGCDKSATFGSISVGGSSLVQRSATIAGTTLHYWGIG